MPATTGETLKPAHPGVWTVIETPVVLSGGVTLRPAKLVHEVSFPLGTFIAVRVAEENAFTGRTTVEGVPDE
ncbi:MAG: hypothetical protein WCN98_06390 [Verrucomicrobiaceae bacterium]|uniref:Unannotated protein n=1 Tax=freshwater metagenome TaxID=449393 RepID=A0A6J7Q9G3_9ZZZZ